jgi:hypothetical protein
MHKTSVIHIRDQQPGDVYIGREGKGASGYFGNPFRLKPGADRGSTITRYRAYFEDKIANDANFRSRVTALKGKRLVCFCAPLPCHGDVIAEWLNTQEED